jgi:hypothetical protein
VRRRHLVRLRQRQRVQHRRRRRRVHTAAPCTASSSASSSSASSAATGARHGRRGRPVLDAGLLERWLQARIALAALGHRRPQNHALALGGRALAGELERAAHRGGAAGRDGRCGSDEAREMRVSQRVHTRAAHAHARVHAARCVGMA